MSKGWIKTDKYISLGRDSPVEGGSGEGCERSDIRGGKMQKLTLGRGVIEQWVKHPYG